MTDLATTIEPRTGEVIEFPGPTVPLSRYRDLEAQLNQAQADLENAEKDLRGKRLQLAKALKDNADGRDQHKHYDAAMRVLEHWKAQVMPRARDLKTGGRLENCLARLADYPEAELVECVDGYARFPYVVEGGRRSASGTKHQWYADAELIFRSAKHVDTGLRLAQAEEAAVEASRAVTLPDPCNEAHVTAAGKYLRAVHQRHGWTMCLSWDEMAPGYRERVLLDAQAALTWVQKWAEHQREKR